VALEAVFYDEARALAGFAGFRRTLLSPDERVRFWVPIVRQARVAQWTSPSHALEDWLRWLHLPATILATTPPSGFALGVFNQWKSAGAIEVGSAEPTSTDLENGPAWVREGAVAPICREMFWLVPERVWIAEVVSEKRGTRYWLRLKGDGREHVG
jgi:hypothetical protein